MTWLSFFCLSGICFLACFSLVAFFVNLYIEFILKVRYNYFYFIFIYIYVFVLLFYLQFNFFDFFLLDLNFNFMQVVFFFSIVIILLVLLLSLFWIVFYFEMSFFFFNEFFFILSFIVISCLLILISADFLFLYLGIELLSFSTYILAAFSRFGNVFVEAVLKYFLIGTVSSCFLLYGISLIYWIFVTTSMVDICCYLDFFLLDPLFLKIFFISLTFIFCTFFVKLALGPFGLWVADLYQGASLPFVFILSTVIKIIFFVYLCIFVWCFFYDCVFYFWFSFEVISLLSLILGNIFAFSERSLLRLLAYSTIPNMGIFCCFNIFSYTEAFNLNLIFFTIYLLNFVVMFLPFFKQGAFYYKQKLSWDLIEFIALKKNILYFTIWIITFFSLSGIPPFVIFYLKFKANFLFFFDSELFSFVIYVFSTLSMYYYNYLVVAFFFKKGLFLKLTEDLLLFSTYQNRFSEFLEHVVWQISLFWQVFCLKLLSIFYVIQPLVFINFFLI